MTLNDFYSRINGDYEEAKTRMMNDKLIDRFVLKFVDDISMSNLKNAVANEDIEDSFHCAHTLKGVSANLAFSALQTAVSDLTEQLRPQTDKADEALYKIVCDKYDVVIAAINDYKAQKEV